jgi:hypothetical protein
MGKRITEWRTYRSIKTTASGCSKIRPVHLLAVLVVNGWAKSPTPEHFMTLPSPRLAYLSIATLAAAAILAGCSMGGAGSSSAGMALAPGLTARMDQPGAVLDRAQALGIVNAYRTSNGLPALIADPALDGTAQALATQYAQTNAAPRTPQDLAGMKLSAGYATFAETFSGWRNNPADAAGLRTTATRAGVAMAFNPTSTYGVYWVLVLDQ